MFVNFLGFLLVISCVFAKEELPVLGIVGGSRLSIRRAPYQASLHSKYGFQCGASIINNTTLLTAAHCTNEQDPKDFKVGVGSDVVDNGHLIQVRDIINYPDFDSKTAKYDLAIIFLEEPISFSKTVRPVELPESNAPLPVGKKGLISGWGLTAEDGKAHSEFLKGVRVPILSMEECHKAYDSDRLDKNFCAGYKKGKRDSCRMDSGGPFVYLGKLLGVISWGEGCAQPDKPGVYTNVALFRDWIRENAHV